MHIELTALEAQILAAKAVMPQCSRERLQILLRDYSEAMRNIDYLTGFSSARHDAAAYQSRPVIPGMQIQTRDHFDYVSFPASAPALDQVRSVLKRLLPAKHAPNQRYCPAGMGRVGLNALDTEVSRLVDGLARIIVAIAGGCVSAGADDHHNIRDRCAYAAGCCLGRCALLCRFSRVEQ